MNELYKTILTSEHAEEGDGLDRICLLVHAGALVYIAKIVNGRTQPYEYFRFNESILVKFHKDQVITKESDIFFWYFKSGDTTWKLRVNTNDPFVEFREPLI